MKSTLLTLALAIPVLAFAADDPTLTGKWQVQMSAAGNESRQDCTFIQKESDLSGTCNSDRGTVQFSGKVDGKNVTWSYKTDSAGGMITVVCKGTVESANRMSGKLNVPEFSVDGEFTATRGEK